MPFVDAAPIRRVFFVVTDIARIGGSERQVTAAAAALARFVYVTRRVYITAQQSYLGFAVMMIDLKDAYKPSDDEPFMNDRQREYFRRKLHSWKEDILQESRETLAALQNENENHPDLADREIGRAHV